LSLTKASRSASKGCVRPGTARRSSSECVCERERECVCVCVCGEREISHMDAPKHAEFALCASHFCAASPCSSTHTLHARLERQRTLIFEGIFTPQMESTFTFFPAFGTASGAWPLHNPAFPAPPLSALLACMLALADAGDPLATTTTPFALLPEKDRCKGGRPCLGEARFLFGVVGRTAPLGLRTPLGLVARLGLLLPGTRSKVEPASGRTRSPESERVCLCV
jgi:hypothetical protein